MIYILTNNIYTLPITVSKFGKLVINLTIYDSCLKCKYVYTYHGEWLMVPGVFSNE